MINQVEVDWGRKGRGGKEVTSRVLPFSSVVYWKERLERKKERVKKRVDKEIKRVDYYYYYSPHKKKKN